MKIIISRKGLDSGTYKNMGISPGNSFTKYCSPIFKDGSMVSLPIHETERIDKKTQKPKHKSLNRFNSYKEIFFKDKSFENLYKDLHGIEPTLNNFGVHFDPDLSKDSKKRLSGWRPNFGQSGGALDKLKDLSEGDLFLFFGRFSHLDFNYDESFNARKIEGKEDMHCFFGWLQTEEPEDAKFISNKPWLDDHPHISHSKFKNYDKNKIYISKESLSLDNRISGGGRFEKYNEKLRLSNPDEKNITSWLLPKWFLNQDQEYRPRKLGCWLKSGNQASCSSHYESFPQSRETQIGQWQETVFDTDYFPEAKDWALDIIKSGLGIK